MQQNVLVIGGSGFIGRHIVAKLSAEGYRVTVPTRRRDRAKAIWMLPTVDVIEGNVRDLDFLKQLMAGKTAVINLVGVLHSRPGAPFGPEFAKAHVELPQKIIEAMKAIGVRRLLHVSALGASDQGPSMYSRSKAAAERLVRASDLDWTLFAPSVVFGPEDKFLNTFAALAKVFPVMPLAGSGARLQPVYVEDVAQAFVNALENKESVGQRYELAGPRIYTLGELVRFASWAAIGKPRLVLPLPLAIGKLQALLFELLPGPTLMSRDNVDSLKADNVSGARGLEALGITPTAMETIASQYLAGKHPRTRFDAYRIEHRD
jgi:uncharacterized protein YbjT (DUF2867 family)